MKSNISFVLTVFNFFKNNKFFKSKEDKLLTEQKIKFIRNLNRVLDKFK